VVVPPPVDYKTGLLAFGTSAAIEEITESSTIAEDVEALKLYTFAAADLSEAELELLHSLDLSSLIQ
jgi:hypothetical protein